MELVLGWAVDVCCSYVFASLYGLLSDQAMVRFIPGPMMQQYSSDQTYRPAMGDLRAVKTERWQCDDKGISYFQRIKCS